MELFAGLSEGQVRFGIFAGVLLAMALLEFLIPRRRPKYTRLRRWFTNLTISGINTAVVKLMSLFVVPLAAVATAMWAQGAGWGLFNWTDWPAWLEITLAVIILDMAIYWQHVASHLIPALWRLHQVHHSDPDFDVTTAIRFHPIEIALSMLYKIVLVLILGPAAVAVVIFEVLLNGCAMFNHANITLPGWLDKVLRTFLVTPDMHRVHHSIIKREHDTNFGFSISIWDRLFRTYTPQPEGGHEGMTIGLAYYRDEKPTLLRWLLLLPFGRQRWGKKREPLRESSGKIEPAE